MEKSLEKHMANVLNNQGVTGVVCTDQNGLCVGVKGNADAKVAGTLSAITQLAEKVLPGEEIPVVCLEGTNTNILLKAHAGYTTAIYKQNTT